MCFANLLTLLASSGLETVDTHTLSGGVSRLSRLSKARYDIMSRYGVPGHVKYLHQLGWQNDFTARATEAWGLQCCIEALLLIF